MDGEIRQEKPPAARPRDRSRSELMKLRESLPPGSKEQMIAAKRVELSDAQHDNTDSWKGEYFGRDMREDFARADWKRVSTASFPLPPRMPKRITCS